MLAKWANHLQITMLITTLFLNATTRNSPLIQWISTITNRQMKLISKKNMLITILCRSFNLTTLTTSIIWIIDQFRPFQTWISTIVASMISILNNLNSSHINLLMILLIKSIPMLLTPNLQISFTQIIKMFSLILILIIYITLPWKMKVDSTSIMITYAIQVKVITNLISKKINKIIQI